VNPPPSILIADDTPENLTVLRDILTRAGYRVRPVLQGSLALKSAIADPPDLILLDIMMPGMDGYETCQALKAHEATADVPVLFISALDATEHKLRGFEMGALDYITKPFRSEEVLARARTHLALREAQKKLTAQNEELRQAAGLREDVDRILRHDLRGALANVIGYSELLTEALPANGSPAEYARVIAGAGYTMLSMVHSSFDLMKMERGVYDRKPEPFDIVTVARQVLSEFGLACGEKDLGHHLHLPDEIPTVIALGERLLTHSLFHNIVKNAIEASPRGGSLDFQFRTVGETVEVTLRNAGEVPEAIRDRFFDKFVTLGKPDGSGIGTYSAKLMAETQGGSIGLDSSEPGFTSIIVSLPLATPEQAAQLRLPSNRIPDISETSPPIELPTARLLIADDDPGNRAYLERVLPNPPLTLFFAATGTAALTALQEQALEAALIDLEMPELDGLDLVRTFRVWQRSWKKSSAGPVLIALSAHQDLETRERCLRAGFDRVLAKPIARKTLLSELKDALTQSAPVVHLDRDIADLIPAFLELQLDVIEQLENLVATEDSANLRSLAHRLQGSFAMYGLHAASRLSTDIEDAGKAADFVRAGSLIADLRTHVTTLEFRYN